MSLEDWVGPIEGNVPQRERNSEPLVRKALRGYYLLPFLFFFALLYLSLFLFFIFKLLLSVLYLGLPNIK